MMLGFGLASWWGFEDGIAQLCSARIVSGGRGIGVIS